LGDQKQNLLGGKKGGLCSWLVEQAQAKAGNFARIRKVEKYCCFAMRKSSNTSIFDVHAHSDVYNEGGRGGLPGMTHPKKSQNVKNVSRLRGLAGQGISKKSMTKPA